MADEQLSIRPHFRTTEIPCAGEEPPGTAIDGDPDGEPEPLLNTPTRGWRDKRQALL